MARGGYRAAAGRPPGAKNKKASIKSIKPAKPVVPAPIAITFVERKEARALGVSPLEYMLSVMNDDEADKARRDRMAIAAAPFVHARAEAEKLGKKEQEETAARTAERGTTWETLLN